jgi:hypothetical protein
MNAPHALVSDPVELVRQLDADTIRERLGQLDRERQALMVLLRAALRTRRDDAAPAGAGTETSQR